MTLQLFNQETYPKSTLSLLDRLAKILVSLENVLGQKKEHEVLLSGKQLDSSLSANHVFLSGRMLKARSPQTLAQTFGQLSKPLPTLGAIDLNGNLLIHAGFYPKIESGYTLSDILETEVDSRYFLSEKQTKYITENQHKITQQSAIVSIPITTKDG